MQAELPTVILSARDARSREVTKVRVFANGELVADALDGTPISLDPGRCELRYESRSGASQTVVIDLAPGERDRRVSIRFDRALRPDGTGAPQIEETTTYTAGPDAPASLARPADEQREPNVLGYVFGAGALVTGSLFGYFEVEGQSRYHDMQAGCGRTQTCTQEQIGDARTDFVLAGSFLAAAVVSAGLATWQFLRPRGRSGTSRSAVRLVVPAPRGFVVRF